LEGGKPDRLEDQQEWVGMINIRARVTEELCRSREGVGFGAPGTDGSLAVIA